MKNTDNTEALLSQLYDIYDPLPLSWWQNPWAYVGAVIAILIVALGWWLYKLSRKPAKPLAYWEQALYDLNHLEQHVLIYEPAQLYQELTDIFKRYAQIRFQQPLVDKTDTEIIAYLPLLSTDDVTLLPEKIAAMKSLFEQGPLIKFAKAPASLEQRAADIVLVREFIQSTRPSIEPDNQANTKKDRAHPESSTSSDLKPFDTRTTVEGFTPEDPRRIEGSKRAKHKK